VRTNAIAVCVQQADFLPVDHVEEILDLLLF
jgi:hypothetical protein